MPGRWTGFCVASGWVVDVADLSDVWPSTVEKAEACPHYVTRVWVDLWRRLFRDPVKCEGCTRGPIVARRWTRRA